MSLLEKASLILTPNAVKALKLYSIVPSNGNGDMDVVRATTATRVNSLGLIENVASNVARLNYEGDCPSLLLEPQRTNLVTYSEDFSNVVWSQTNVMVTANLAISPNGTQDADSLQGNSGTNSKILTGQFSVVSGTTYSISVFAKKNTNNFIQIVGGTVAFGLNSFANFDLNNGTIGTIGSSNTAKIENYSNGWYRCTISATAIASAVNSFSCILITSSTSVRAEPNSLTTSVYIWGAQLEQGAYPTSYIPTVASTVTRNADVVSKTGISDLIGQTEGVLFVESAALFDDLTIRAISISNGTFGNRMYLYYFNQSNKILLSGTSNGVNFSNTIEYVLTDETQFAKIALRYKANDISLWINGIKRGIDITSQTLPINLSRFGFDSGTGSGNLYAKTKQVQLYKTYLTDTEMANLTTL